MIWRAGDFAGRDDFSADYRADVYEEVRNGRGFALLRGAPVDSLELFVEHVRSIGRRFGRELSQNAEGELIGHVQDASGADKTPRLFRSNLELRLHTDNAAVVVLGCWSPARSGGETHLTCASAVHHEMNRRRPDLLQLLYRGFHCHRRGEQGPHEEPVTPYRVPVFSVDHGAVSCRYQRALIAGGHRELGLALSSAEVEALDLLDEIAAAAQNCLAFALDRGDVLVLNNYTVLHARSAFREHAEPARRRHLVRIWLHDEAFRRVPSHFQLFPSAEGIPAQPGRTCSYDFERLYREDPVASGAAKPLR